MAERIDMQVIFSAIPLFPAVMLILLALSGSLSQPDRFFSFLGLLSLVGSACIMNFSPSQSSDNKSLVPRPRSLAVVLQFAVPINAAICGLLVLAYIMGAQMGPSPRVQLLIYIVPGGAFISSPQDIEGEYLVQHTQNNPVMFASVMAVRHAMATVEFRQLEDLRYEYKGA